MAYLPVSRQMPKCPFGTLREPGQPVRKNCVGQLGGENG
jgi:hypothetical protein